MGELSRRPPGLAPCCQTGRTERRRGEEHSPRSKESQEEGKATTTSAVVTFHMQHRLSLACRAIQPLTENADRPHHMDATPSLPEKTDGCLRRHRISKKTEMHFTFHGRREKFLLVALDENLSHLLLARFNSYIQASHILLITHSDISAT